MATLDMDMDSIFLIFCWNASAKIRDFQTTILHARVGHERHNIGSCRSVSHTPLRQYRPLHSSTGSAEISP